MLSKPLGDDLFSYPRLKTPYIWVFQLSFNDFIQSVESAIVLANSLLEFEVDAPQSSAVLKLGLVVDICRSKAVDLDPAYELSTPLPIPQRLQEDFTDQCV